MTDVKLDMVDIICMAGLDGKRVLEETMGHLPENFVDPRCAKVVLPRLNAAANLMK